MLICCGRLHSVNQCENQFVNSTSLGVPKKKKKRFVHLTSVTRMYHEILLQQYYRCGPHVGNIGMVQMVFVMINKLHVFLYLYYSFMYVYFEVLIVLCFCAL